jgi:hypothetical protein
LLDQLEESFDFRKNSAIRSVRLDTTGLLSVDNKFPPMGVLIGIIPLLTASSVKEVDITIRSYDERAPNAWQIDDFTNIATFFEPPQFRCLQHLQFRILQHHRMEWEAPLKDVFSMLDSRDMLRLVYYTGPDKTDGDGW